MRAGWTSRALCRSAPEHIRQRFNGYGSDCEPDRLERLTQTRLLDALGSCRQAVISAQTQVKVAGPVYHGCQMVTSAIDALAPDHRVRSLLP
jgi:hypothetical protein